MKRIWFVVCCLCFAGASHASEATLLQRIEALEQRVSKLEQSNDNWKDPVYWSRIKKDMPTADVEKIIGKPNRVETAIFTTWYYHPTSKTHSFVWFDEGKVLGFEAPK